MIGTCSLGIPCRRLDLCVVRDRVLADLHTLRELARGSVAKISIRIMLIAD
jgi:hypothetical protein